MPISIEELVEALNPTNASLLMGAGSSIPSGAPSATQLTASIVASLNNPELAGANLTEAAGIYELKNGRKALIRLIGDKLAHLKTTGGLLNLPNFNWQSIYTTNYDTLIEQSYSRANKELKVIRGNADFGANTSSATPLLKLHGCITQDISASSESRLVITEADYEEYEKYRELLFERLSYDMMKNDVLIIGHSLADPNIREVAIRALNVKMKRGAPGKIYLLVYEKNIDRALLLEQRGLKVAFGALDDLMDKLWVRAPSVVLAASASDDPIESISRLNTRVVDTSHAATLAADPFQMFNGRAASHADVTAGLCFERTLANRISSEIGAGQFRIASIIGPAGVGKTTLCRLIAEKLRKQGFFAWDHKYDTYLESKDWIVVADKLKKLGAPGVLFVDECHREMRQLNALCDYIGSDSASKLHIIVCSSASQWRPRIKSKYYFSAGVGKSFWVDRLDDQEIHSLLMLLETNASVKSMVRDGFLRQPHQRKFDLLRRRCSADMFVCLKNLFATEKIDDILLQEFADMSEPLQDVYRHVAAMESLNVKVHRQLVLRCTDILAASIPGLLEDLRGIIEEYDINERMGLYGWETRHSVIAQIITSYKFADQTELENLIGRIIENLNPSIDIELRSAIGLCDRDYGIGRLASREMQNKYYRQLIDLVPTERVPRHRLIGNLLSVDRLEEADQELRSAEKTVRVDAPLMRYKVRIGIRRAENATTLQQSDRRAIAGRALEIARDGVRRFPKDKFMYATECDAARAFVEHGGDTSAYAQSVETMKAAYPSILDPEMADALRRHESELRRIGAKRAT